MDGIFTEMSDESRSYFSAACSDTYRFQLRRLLSGSIAETIALGYKNIFVRNCLHVNKGNFLQNVLINTMCVFDKTYDQQIVSKIIDVDKPVFIDGYCNFRLQPLKKSGKKLPTLLRKTTTFCRTNNWYWNFCNIFWNRCTAVRSNWRLLWTKTHLCCMTDREKFWRRAVLLRKIPRWKRRRQ